MAANKTPAGYSGTPLAKKLGFKHGERVFTRSMPASVREEIEAAVQAKFAAKLAPGVSSAHVFHMRAAALESDLKALRKAIAPDGQIWVSWPKKAAKVDTDITEDVVRRLALPLGLVDVKVCAVDATWSGLKLVVRKALR